MAEPNRTARDGESPNEPFGQPDPGLLTGGDYTLGGGFWGGGAQRVGQNIYLPLVLKGFP